MRYFLLFQNTPRNHWYKIFTRNNFEHVDLLIYNPESEIINIIQPSLNLTHFDSKYCDNIEEYLKDIEKYNIINLEVNKINNRYFLFGLHTCVGICKRLIGVNNIFIFTPYQLYKYCKKNRGI